MGLDLTLVKITLDDKGSPKRLYDESLDYYISLSSTINRKYLSEVEHKSVGDDPERPAYFYKRPVNFEKAVEWVKANIDEYNSSIALKTLSLMKENEDYYLLEDG